MTESEDMVERVARAIGDAKPGGEHDATVREAALLVKEEALPKNEENEENEATSGTNLLDSVRPIYVRRAHRAD